MIRKVVHGPGDGRPYGFAVRHDVEDRPAVLVQAIEAVCSLHSNSPNKSLALGKNLIESHGLTRIMCVRIGTDVECTEPYVRVCVHWLRGKRPAPPRKKLRRCRESRPWSSSDGFLLFGYPRCVAVVRSADGNFRDHDA